MIVIHIESGLGNQMLSYCEYLSLKFANPNQKFYIETIVFEIPECNEVICQWNGYELEKIFGINQPKNIKTLFSKDEWAQIIQEIRSTEFWIHNWNYPVIFTEVLNRHGLHLKNVRGDFDPNHNIITGTEDLRKTWKDKFRESYLGYTVRRLFLSFNEERYAYRMDSRDKLFLQTEEDIFTGQWLKINYRGNDIHLIESEIRNSFTFPPITDLQNKEMAEYLQSINSVAIHARRGDMAGTLAYCYNYGYFKRAVKYIRKHVENPVFVFFTNPGSVEWCKEHAAIFGLDIQKDTIRFVDWNKGEDSFRDMQLMGLCKHTIVTSSSFGWWGTFFNTNPNKITISPAIELNTTHHC